MSRELKTVTIGMTAYNESQNIRKLLRSLVNQKADTFILEKIIVISDGSKDTLFHEVNSIADSRIELIQYMQRRGKPFRLNELSQKNTSDILVIVDADIVPVNEDFLSEIVKPFTLEKNIGIVSGAIVPVKSETLFEEIISSSVIFKRRIFENYNKKNNIYLCHGRVRAFSNEFLKKFSWQNAVCEDAYSYLMCQQEAFVFRYAGNAEVFYRSPQTLQDHLKQSIRYHSGRKNLEMEFGKSTVREAFSLPKGLFVKHYLHYFLTRPHLSVPYCLVVIFTRLMLLWQKRTDVIWDVSGSSKYVIKEGLHV